MAESVVGVPLISCVQKIEVYETQTRLYVVGSNASQSLHRILKVDRTDPKDLVLLDDDRLYSKKEVKDLLLMIDNGNRPNKRSTTGFSKALSGFGLLGFVKFVEGFYMLVITRRRKAAVIGNHTVYKIEDTSMIYIPNNAVRIAHPDENKYVKLFQSIDLSSNFYFSFSYDLTHNLQYFMTPCRDLEAHYNHVPFGKHAAAGVRKDNAGSQLPPASSNFKKSERNGLNKENNPVDRNIREAVGVEELKDKNPAIIHEKASTWHKTGNESCSREPQGSLNQTKISPDDKMTTGNVKKVCGVRWEPVWQFVWNEYLLQPMKDAQVHPDWVLPIIHGFIGQSLMDVFGKPVFLTLIARRSNKFAGTRFLKRGANWSGYVANEVETEQIVQDGSISDLAHAKITSFVQMRGSLPMFWSQDISKMMPKPAISVDQADPYGFVSGQHFQRLLERFGTPLIILNLVKTKEELKRESLLCDALEPQISYLNQFLPPDQLIKHIKLDMARLSKRKDASVFERLETIAEVCVKQTGFFQSGCNFYCNQLRPHPKAQSVQGLKQDGRVLQHGVLRTNCVDCLDRTNTAQFAVCKHALALQLHAMGIIHTPSLPFESDCVRMLEELYEDQGDTLALQYGGSQLVHRIKGYRNITHFTSYSKDIMHTLSRYYSNTFSDNDKQHAINVFLGVFRPYENCSNVWDLQTDFFLHNPVMLFGATPRSNPYTYWWSPEIWSSLPGSAEEDLKGKKGQVVVVKTLEQDERVNQMWEFYKPYEITSFDSEFFYQMPHSLRDFKPKGADNLSPFVERAQPGRRLETLGIQNPSHNPNITGHDSTSSVTSGGSEGSDSSDSGDSDIEGDYNSLREQTPPTTETEPPPFILKTALPTMKQTYGVSIKYPKDSREVKSMQLYKRFAQIAENASSLNCEQNGKKPGTVLFPCSSLPLDSISSVEPPQVKAQSKELYKLFVARSVDGPQLPNSATLLFYQMYAAGRLTSS